MTKPVYSPTITLGNILTIIGMAVSAFVFIFTTSSDVKAIREWQVAVDPIIKSNANSIISLNEWKNVGPRFTSSDASLLKAQTLQESQIYTNKAVEKVGLQVVDLSDKLDKTNALLTEIRILIASNSSGNQNRSNP